MPFPVHHHAVALPCCIHAALHAQHPQPSPHMFSKCVWAHPWQFSDGPRSEIAQTYVHKSLLVIVCATPSHLPMLPAVGPPAPVHSQNVQGTLSDISRQPPTHSVHEHMCMHTFSPLLPMCLPMHPPFMQATVTMSPLISLYLCMWWHSEGLSVSPHCSYCPKQSTQQHQLPPPLHGSCTCSNICAVQSLAYLSHWRSLPSLPIVLWAPGNCTHPLPCCPCPSS